MTLGTVFHVESGDLFSRVLAGVRDLPVEVVVTVGNEIDPRELGRQPANVHVERFIPQGAVLPEADLVISHGGSGSVLGALVFGLPMVVLAMGADQPLNAARCRALGVAETLDPVEATPADIRAAVERVLGDDRWRDAARTMRREIDGMPGPEEAVGAIERLGAG